MSAVLLRLVLVLVFTFWTVQVLAVAVFAVQDRASGLEGLVLSLIVLVGGFAPVAFLVYLFRDHLPLPPRYQTPHSLEPPSRRSITIEASPEPPRLEPPVESISERELEVLALMSRGMSNKEIASHLSVTVGTVKTHTNNINRKLGTRTRAQAIARAREHGLL